MEYVSTRGAVSVSGFKDVLLAGLAPDAGLYTPAVWPQLTHDEIAALRGRPYADIAAAVMGRFVGEAFAPAELRAMAADAYGAFGHPDIAPVIQVGEDDWILELFHGPTLAFKDYAMQLLARMFDAVLARRGARLTIIAATSGDTGAAAVDAFKSSSRVDIVVLHPQGRITEVQRRMMTTTGAANVFNIAVDGDFDACQAIVKDLFADRGFAKTARLSGVNSINWARLAAQTAYYFTASLAVAPEGETVSFVVPTGNFGDVFAGYGAKKMGLAVDRLGVAANANDILHRAMTTGDYAPAVVSPTISPSMDIQVASNFERLLFEAMDRDGDAVRTEMAKLRKTGAMRLNADIRAKIAADFVSCVAGEDETLAEIERHRAETGALIDPHTAVGRHAARALRAAGALTGKIVTLATAHPAKFPDAVERATGVRPKLPPLYADLFARPETMTRAPAGAAAVRTLILQRLSDRGTI